MSMTSMDVIACQRGHEHHATRLVTVNLGGQTPYADLAPVPMRLRRSFQMVLFDPGQYPIDGGPYCPAHDAVSHTIYELGIWEPRETILTLTVLRPDDVMLDLGAQIGWFSLLAASCEAKVWAWEADAQARRLLQQSAKINGWMPNGLIESSQFRIDPDTPTLGARTQTPLRLVKIDVEGAEFDAVRILDEALDAGNVDHLCMEVSPCFGYGYGDLVQRIIDHGYESYLLPPKQQPPVALDDPAKALDPYRLHTMSPNALRAEVESWHQEDVWFKHEEASW